MFCQPYRVRPMSTVVCILLSLWCNTIYTNHILTMRFLVKIMTVRNQSMNIIIPGLLSDQTQLEQILYVHWTFIFLVASSMNWTLLFMAGEQHVKADRQRAREPISIKGDHSVARWARRAASLGLRWSPDSTHTPPPSWHEQPSGIELWISVYNI